jgi:hypothetical protein
VVIATRYVLGLDLGPVGTFTALAILERTDTNDPDAAPMYVVRHLHRFAPGTPYATIVGDVIDKLHAEPLEDALLVLDVTAVGGGVADLFRHGEPFSRIVSVVVTAGHHAENDPFGIWLVPKKDLVTRLQLLLQGRRLVIPTALQDADLLIRELGAFRAKVSLATDPTQADWRESAQDDLVFAVALACWKAGRLPAALGEYGSAVEVTRLGPYEPRSPFPVVGGRRRWEP